MEISAVLLRWYRSFNVRTLGPADEVPDQPWNHFRDQVFPFVTVSIDRKITTIVGANESGKSYLLAAIAKVINGCGFAGETADPYEIKDICRYCGFDGLDDTVWPEIGLELLIAGDDPALPELIGVEDSGSHSLGPKPGGCQDLTVSIILNGAADTEFAKVYSNHDLVRRISKGEWRRIAATLLPEVAVLDSRLALPNEVHVDELIDLYNQREPQAVVDPLGVQDLWRAIEPIKIVQGNAVDAQTAQSIQKLKSALEESTRTSLEGEGLLVRQFFSEVLAVSLADLNRIREYSNNERGFVERLLSEINERIDRELDISRYWDQDEDFRLSVNYKSGMFHFQINDRTGATYTFNERSSGLRYFLSYYIQAKALERRKHGRGVVILMDEPDSYLSASGQRSLLRVFDALVSHKTAEATCQLIYSTHSPFLINRNFPGRIRLVRKGDGTEGTQYVERAAVRRFEPVRSALSIDAADTLFLGSVNVVLEGFGDQKLLTACIQRFGEPGRVEQVLDLNTVTLVSAGGAQYAAQFVRKAMKGDEKPPIVVVMLDGDDEGTTAVQKVVEVIDEKQAITLRDIDFEGEVFQVLEDLVPIDMLTEAIRQYFARESFGPRVDFDGTSQGTNNAQRIVNFCQAEVPELAEAGSVEIRAGVIDCLAELITDESRILAGAAVLQARVETLCARLNEMIEHAQRVAGRHSLKKLLRQAIETFLKRYPLGASKGDVKKLLKDMSHAASGKGEDAERSRHNIGMLIALVDKEAQQNSDMVNLAAWRLRLTRLKDKPWGIVKDWASLLSVEAQSQSMPAAVVSKRADVIGQPPSSLKAPENSAVIPRP